MSNLETESNDSGLEYLKCSEVYPCNLHVSTYSDLSSYQEPSDISEGELGPNKENLPKFISTLGDENLSKRHFHLPSHCYASPIAKTKLLKNAFDSGEKILHHKTSRETRGNTPHSLCVKSARPHF